MIYPTWQGKTGINIFGPFGGPVASGGMYSNDPYSASSWGPWATHVTPAVFEQMRDVGIDHIRLQINPGPFIQALATGDTTMLASLDVLLDEAVDDCIAEDFPLVISPIMTGYTAWDVVTTILQGINTTAYQRYRTLLVHWANRYKIHSPSMVCFEPLNEPPSPSDFPANWADAVQPDMVAAIREAASDHTIIGTCANYSSIFDFVNLDAAPYDQNMLWSPHPFVPTPFCLQGAVYSGMWQYITNLSWPPVAADKTAAIATMTANVNASGMSSGEKIATIATLTTQLGYYFDIPQNLTWLNDLFDTVTSWWAAQGLSPSHIYMGEWGAVRFNSSFLGASRLPRIRYYRDISSAIQTHGFRSAFDHLDTYDYGVTTAEGSAIGPWDAPMLEAIGPGRLRLVRRELVSGE